MPGMRSRRLLSPSLSLALPCLLLPCLACVLRHNITARRAVKSGRHIFDEQQVAALGLGECWLRLQQLHGCVPKALAVSKWYDDAFARGSWNDGDEAVQFWGFLVGSFMVSAWMFPFWLLFKKLALTGILWLLDGASNAACATALQARLGVRSVRAAPVHVDMNHEDEMLARKRFVCFTLAVPMLSRANIRNVRQPQSLLPCRHEP